MREEKNGKREGKAVIEGAEGEKKFSYRRIILSCFLRRHLRKGSWLGLIKS